MNADRSAYIEIYPTDAITGIIRIVEENDSRLAAVTIGVGTKIEGVISRAEPKSLFPRLPILQNKDEPLGVRNVVTTIVKRLTLAILVVQALP